MTDTDPMDNSTEPEPSSGEPERAPETGPQEKSNGPLDPEKIRAAQSTRLEGDVQGTPTTGPPPGGPEATAKGVSGDGAGGLATPAEPGPPAPTSEKRTKQSIGLCQGLSRAAEVTANIFAGTDLDISETDHTRLGEAWGKVLRHFVYFEDGTKIGDASNAVAVTSDVLQDQMEQGAFEISSGDAENEGRGDAANETQETGS